MVARFPFEYLVREPAAPLDRLVESIWYARGRVPYTREKIAPTGSSVVVFVLGDPIEVTADDGKAETLRSEEGFLIGPHDRPVVNQPLGETFAVGIVATPVGCEALFGVAPREVRGRALPVTEAWSEAADLRHTLRQAASGEEMLALVEAHLREQRRALPTGFDRAEAAVRLLEAAPTRPIAEVAEQLGVSHGHLARQFAQVVGLTPRVLARLLRIRRMLESLDLYGTQSWADRAAELGWYDQAHLIRDFKRHTGVTPSKYVAAQRATYEPEFAGDGAGFVPEV